MSIRSQAIEWLLCLADVHIVAETTGSGAVLFTSDHDNPRVAKLVNRAWTHVTQFGADLPTDYLEAAAYLMDGGK